MQRSASLQTQDFFNRRKEMKWKKVFLSLLTALLMSELGSGQSKVSMKNLKI